MGFSEQAREQIRAADSDVCPKQQQQQQQSDKKPEQAAHDQQTAEDSAPAVMQYDPGVIDYGEFAAQIRRTVQQGSCLFKDPMADK